MPLATEKKRLTDYCDVYARSQSFFVAKDKAGKGQASGSPAIRANKSIATRKLKNGVTTLSKEEVERRKSKGEKINE